MSQFSHRSATNIHICLAKSSLAYHHLPSTAQHPFYGQATITFQLPPFLSPSTHCCLSHSSSAPPLTLSSCYCIHPSLVTQPPSHSSIFFPCNYSSAIIINQYLLTMNTPSPPHTIQPLYTCNLLNISILWNINLTDIHLPSTYYLSRIVQCHRFPSDNFMLPCTTSKLQPSVYYMLPIHVSWAFC